MRLLDITDDASLDRLLILLTRVEASELRGVLDRLLAHPDNNHEHVADSDYQKEITVALYGAGVKNEFNERSTNLLDFDK